MLKKKLIISNDKGLHARAASAFAQVAANYDTKIVVQKGSEFASGTSILGLMMLGATKDSEITLTCDGTDEEEVMNELVNLVEQGFYE